jgi:hypothetical protein
MIAHRGGPTCRPSTACQSGRSPSPAERSRRTQWIPAPPDWFAEHKRSRTVTARRRPGRSVTPQPGAPPRQEDASPTTRCHRGPLWKNTACGDRQTRSQEFLRCGSLESQNHWTLCRVQAPESRRRRTGGVGRSAGPGAAIIPDGPSSDRTRPYSDRDAPASIVHREGGACTRGLGVELANG